MYAQKARNGTYSPAPPGAYLYLALGRNSYLLQRALHPAKAAQAQAEVPQDAPALPEAPPPPMTGPVEQEDMNHPDAFAHLEQAGVGAAALPSRWFGYRTADTIVLYTGVPTFTRELLDERTGRKEALAEWVRRGGRLVISAGHEHQLVKALLEKMQLIGVTINGAVQRRRLEALPPWAGVAGYLSGKPRRAKAGAPPVTPALELLNLDVDPAKGVRALVTEPAAEDEPKPRPVILEAPCGLGRVVLVAFDLDQGPFLEWPFASQAKFWQKMTSELRPNQAREHAQPAVNNNNWGGMGNDNSRADVGTMMQDRLESFDEVPVISFGWVALFILIYIIIVGPLDYFFLKKVVKRLELTWITFPAVVLTVSAVAYVSAYYLKGNDLRINKVDVVDVVAEPAGSGTVRGSQAYGSTWFTLFSPRIQNYTIGVEPAAPSWVPDALADPSTTNPNPYGVLTGWMGRPENAWGGAGRSGSSPGLFGRRAYHYTTDAAALEGVPIQVWSTKSFTASWQAALPEDRPLFEADLKRTGQRSDHIGGTITSRLPAALDNVVLFYRGQRYDLGRLEPGAPRPLDNLAVGAVAGGPERAVETWFSQDMQMPVYNNNPWQQRYGPAPHYESAFGIVKELMFAGADGNTGHPFNSTLRYLDATWRMQRGDELVVLGRVPRQVAAAEQVSQDAASPTRLWLGQVPAPGEARRPLAGKLSQETYVRAFLPVPPLPPK
jgi:hypothetical protein